MSTKAIMDVMADLIKLHQTFNQLAVEKTEAIKNSDMPSLDKLLKQETAYVKKLRKLEEDRLFVVNQYLANEGLVTEGVTMGNLVELVPSTEQVLLGKLQKALLSEIDRLRKRNELNQQLIEDSLRFVNLSLDLIAPEPEEVNYKRPTKTSYEENTGRSLFDSKA
ncbi:flagellar protein FlgN [Bacillus sp. FJAT-45350]|uniref:flagellar protein FlgN n=1 Tax=Bacillus sp. FJAT-45350 TaxID=2011014 RepID=UPI000BB7208A|nr:flagellar protein FlgN [Bacillus sp. FJAT-45350]